MDVNLFVVEKSGNDFFMAILDGYLGVRIGTNLTYHSTYMQRRGTVIGPAFVRIDLGMP